MARSFSLLVVVGALYFGGCGGASSAIAPEPPWPPPPPVVVEQEQVVPVDPQLRSDEETRQSALHVMATEQRGILNGLENDAQSFVRTSTALSDRLQAAFRTSERDLSSIEQEIANLDSDVDLSPSARRDRHDDIKDRLRRLATRLSLMQAAIRER